MKTTRLIRVNLASDNNQIKTQQIYKTIYNYMGLVWIN